MSVDKYKSRVDHKKVQKYFKVLANSVRLKLYLEILEEACECNLDEQGSVWGNCVSHLCHKLDLPQPTVSNHVKELISADLIYSERKGKNVYLFGNPDIIDVLSNLQVFIEREIHGHD